MTPREARIGLPRRLAAAIGLALVVTACTGHAAPAKLLPPQGAYLGMFYGSESLPDTTRAIGAVPKIRLTYFGWHDDWTGADTTGDDFEAGRIP